MDERVNCSSFSDAFNVSITWEGLRSFPYEGFVDYLRVKVTVRYPVLKSILTQ